MRQFGNNDVDPPYTSAEIDRFMRERSDLSSLGRFLEQTAVHKQGDSTTMAECKCLEEVKKLAKWPFYRPVVINQDTRNLECPGWAVMLFEETPSGRISSKSAGSLFLNYCPICGESLREVKESASEQGGS